MRKPAKKQINKPIYTNHLNHELMSGISRRQFLKTGATAALGLSVVPNTVLGKSFGHVAPSDKLNIAAVGIGGMGHANINAVKNTERRILPETSYPLGIRVASSHPSCRFDRRSYPDG